MQEKGLGGFLICVLKGVGLALVTAIIGILIFAVVVKNAYLNQNVITAVNQFIKILSIFIGCFFSIKSNAGLIKGIAVGLTFTVLIYLIFALVCGGGFGTAFLLDLGFGLVLGGIFGVVAMLKRSD